MWIMLLNKLPTEISPPSHSIHWAGASAEDVHRSHKQKARAGLIPVKTKGMRLTDVGDKFSDEFFGYEAKEEGAVWIIFDSEPIKVWPHEYSAVDKENMKEYIMLTIDGHMCMSHVPMYGREALFVDPITNKFIKNGFEKHPEFNKETYEAALIDGAYQLEAFYTSLTRIPKNLWFSMNADYADALGLSKRERIAVYRRKEAKDVYEQIKSGWDESGNTN